MHQSLLCGLLRIGATAILLTLSAPAPATEPALVVIVHPSRARQLSAEEVGNIYLKRRRFWSDGAPIVAVNREPGSDARETFSRRLLGGPSADFAAYWNEQYFQGIFPPITLSSSAAVKRYTATDPNAIGYVEAGEADDSVRVVLQLKP